MATENLTMMSMEHQKVILGLITILNPQVHNHSILLIVSVTTHLNVVVTCNMELYQDKLYEINTRTPVDSNIIQIPCNFFIKF